MAKGAKQAPPATPCWVAYDAKVDKRGCCESTRDRALALQRKILLAVFPRKGGLASGMATDDLKLEYADVRTGHGDEYLPTLRAEWLPKARESPDAPPLLALHGMGGGLAMWALNVETMTRASPSGVAYFADLPGFACSSRTEHKAKTCEAAEEYFVTRVEGWRRTMVIDRMVLAGHSLGGFLSACYSLAHPQHVEHLVLVDPWGVDVRTQEAYENLSKRAPWYIRAAASLSDTRGPLFALRWTGPLGKNLMKLRPGLGGELRNYLSGGEIQDYFFCCNTQSPATGELHFMQLQIPYAFAARPLFERLPTLAAGVKLDFIYGANTWMKKEMGLKVTRAMDTHDVGYAVVDDAGHQVFLENASGFNKAFWDAVGRR